MSTARLPPPASRPATPASCTAPCRPVHTAPRPTRPAPTTLRRRRRIPRTFATISAAKRWRRDAIGRDPRSGDLSRRPRPDARGGRRAMAHRRPRRARPQPLRRPVQAFRDPRLRAKPPAARPARDRAPPPLARSAARRAAVRRPPRAERRRARHGRRRSRRCGRSTAAPPARGDVHDQPHARHREARCALQPKRIATPEEAGAMIAALHAADRRCGRPRSTPACAAASSSACAGRT